jgi:aspartyl-tRNA(Asn)/glutamyl-tRNA(Gln) amidotransferase subunit B
VLRTLNEQNTTLEKFPLRPPALAELVKAVSAGDIEITRAKEVFNEMVSSGRGAGEIMKSMGIEKVDASELVKLCEELVAANPKIVADVKGGKEQAVSSLIGQAKKKNPNAMPAEVKRICLEIIAKLP